jgi:cholesterol transport system auxiliary component
VFVVIFARRSRASLSACAAILALALGGCSGMGGLLSKGPPAAYDLAAASDFPRRAGGARGQLVITEPIALAPYDSEKIVVRPAPGEAAQLTDAQWEDRLPKLMQARILQSFENASRLRAVGRPADKIVNDFVLITDIRAFEISASDNTAVVEIAAKIVRDRTGRIMAARVFRVTVPAQATQGAGAVAALNEAFVKAETQLVLWAAGVV